MDYSATDFYQTAKALAPSIVYFYTWENAEVKKKKGPKKIVK